MSHFLVVLGFVSTDFNCFLKSIRRSIPMTVAVKLTSTRRCMTCSFFVAFFVFYQERDLAVCAAVIVLRGERFAATRVFERATRDIISVSIHNTHSNFEFYGLNQFGRVTRTVLPLRCGSGERRRVARRA